MACLIYLFSAIVEYASDQVATTEFIDSLQKEVLERVARHYVCSEEFLHLLFQGGGEAGSSDPERVWQVARLMSMAKKLSKQWWQRVFQHLLLVLRLADDAGEETADVERWDTDALRLEIYGQLYPLWTTLRQTWH
jgi:hypothetical protein